MSSDHPEAEEVTLPSQKVKPVTPTDDNELSYGDPKFEAENADWIKARLKVNQSPNNGLAWDELVVLSEKVFQKYTSPSDTVKNVITETFEELLTRFPLFYGYWKKYTAIKYQMEGLDASIAVLSKALDAFPTSLELWVDYLTLLISNYGEQTTRIRTEFQIAARNVGHQFLSHTFWDKYIEWEQQQNEPVNVVSILLAVIKIPLHQYARYYQDLLQKKDTISIDQLVTLDLELQESIPADSTPEQKSQLVTEYITKVCTNTYTYVTEIWPHEAQVTDCAIFTLSPVPESVSKIWETYLDFQLKKHKDAPTTLNKLQTISLFERALVPNALDVKFWNRYLTWALDVLSDDFDRLNSIYNRAVNLYAPVNMYLVRLNYALFLEVHKQDTDKIQELYLNIIGHAPAESRPVVQYMQFVSRLNGDPKATAKWIEGVVTGYFGKQEKGSDLHATRLTFLLNAKTAGVLLAELIKVYWYQANSTKDVIRILETYGKKEELSGSVPFWSIAYKFERAHGSRKSMEELVRFIKLKSSLPLTTINAVLMDYTDYLQQNHTPAPYREILKLEYDVANPLHYRITDEKQLKKVKSESGHAGVYIQKPTITNASLDEPVKRFRPEPLPTFKNVEKAALPVEYTQNT